MANLEAYPRGPGYKDLDTSMAAAVAVAPKVAGQCATVVELLTELGPMSPEQMLGVLHARGERALLTSLRARCTQLRHLGIIRDSFKRGLGESLRCKVIVWEMVPKSKPQQPELFGGSQ